MTEHEDYCVSIRKSYRPPYRKPVGCTVVLWAWSSYDETWWYAARREYLFADYNSSHKKALRRARRDARKLAGIFDCTNHDTNEKGMWQ
ncbi:hypothetical protein [Bifidobacterium catenulatum]|uniref:Uncharacterized protein n=1 Tax=Bifidobacterium catenulatum PV20-2 TaxID=1447716 RepID=A0A0A7I599_9BIFI|nr:hypothetical protein [Bifidobacterium catenulatum]AIZ15423.1 hypothetical protein AH68_04895 [Bifidobacterium catenulatum PV20-2]